MIKPNSIDKALVELVAAPKKPGSEYVKSVATSKEGYLLSTQLIDLAEFVIEIKSGKGNIGNSNIKQLGSFWQVATANNQYLKYVCFEGIKKIEYLVFNVFVPESTMPVAQVGVSDLENKVLEQIEIHSPKHADDILDNKLAGKTPGILNPQTPPAPKSASEEKSVAESPAPEVSAAPKSSTPKTEEPQSQSSPQQDSKDDAQEIPVIKGGLSFVICSQEDFINVRDQSLNKVLFKAQRFEEVKMVQQWQPVKGAPFVNVQFPARKFGENIGWVSAVYIKAKSDCKEVKKVQQSPAQIKISGDCCEFPTIDRPTESYLTGMRRFKAGRSGGRRLHAGCDLYRTEDEDIVSVGAGTIIRDKYYFYQGTYALEVKHAPGFIIRYGEVTGKKIDGISAGKTVNRGQLVAYMGKVNSGCCEPMLHFEMYSGNATGSLTQPKRKGFQRRADLVNPTGYLRNWEQAKFGDSY